MRGSSWLIGPFATSLFAGGATPEANGFLQEQAVLSRAETAKLVKNDLARRLKVEAKEIEVVAESDATWTDSTLGCSGRKPLDEPVSTLGFALTLSHRGRSYVYHTDRRGHFRRCEAR